MPSKLKKQYSPERFRKIRNNQKRRYYRKHYIDSGMRRWTAEEDKIIYRKDLSDVEKSKLIRRSVAAIQQRRYIKKKIM